MRLRIVLAAATLVLFAVLTTLGAVGWVVARAAPRTGLDVVPRDAVAVAGVSFQALESWAPMYALTTDVLSLPALQPHAAAIRAACRTEPRMLVGSAVFALGARRAADGSDEDALVLQGPLHPRGGLVPCLESVASEIGRARLERQRGIYGHDSFAMRSLGGADGALPWLGFAHDAVVFADPAQLARTLEVLDERAPGANQNDRLRAARGDVGGAVAWGVIDTRAAAHASNVGATGLLDALRAVSPLLGLEVQGPSSESVAAGVFWTAAGVRFAFTLRFALDSDAESARAGLADWLDGERTSGRFDAALTSLEALYLARVGAPQVAEPSLATRALALQRAFALINALPDRVTLRTAGPTVRFELALSSAELAALFDAAHAAIACQLVFDRTAPAAVAP